jgi:hypothetical protein
MAKNHMAKSSGNSGGMFVQSEEFAEEHGGRVGDIACLRTTLNFRFKKRTLGCLHAAY